MYKIQQVFKLNGLGTSHLPEGVAPDTAALTSRSIVCAVKTGPGGRDPRVLSMSLWSSSKGKNPSGTPKELAGESIGCMMLKNRVNAPSEKYPTSPISTSPYWPRSGIHSGSPWPSSMLKHVHHGLNKWLIRAIGKQSTELRDVNGSDNFE